MGGKERRGSSAVSGTVSPQAEARSSRGVLGAVVLGRGARCRSRYSPGHAGRCSLPAAGRPSPASQGMPGGVVFRDSAAGQPHCSRACATRRCAWSRHSPRCAGRRVVLWSVPCVFLQRSRCVRSPESGAAAPRPGVPQGSLLPPGEQSSLLRLGWRQCAVAPSPRARCCHPVTKVRYCGSGDANARWRRVQELAAATR